MRRVIIFLLSLVVFVSNQYLASGAILRDLSPQILSSDLKLTAAEGPFVLSGKLQVPQGMTLTIEPGAVLIVRGGEIVSAGTVVIGSNSSIQKSYIYLEKVNRFILGGEIIVQNSVIKGINRYEGSFSIATRSVTIDNSDISNLGLLSSETPNLLVTNTIFVNMQNVAQDNGTAKYVFLNNAFYEVSFFYAYANLGSGNNLTLESNVFLNDSVPLEIGVPGNGFTSTFKNNHFMTPRKLTLYIKPGDATGNYWSVNSESELRATAKVIDGITDVLLKRVNFMPMLSSPPIVPNRIEAFLSSKQIPDFPDITDSVKAAADKAAAELKAKQDAEAKAAADKVLADARAQAAKIIADAKAKAIKKTSITCIKGKLVKKVTAVNPKCPAGYKKK